MFKIRPVVPGPPRPRTVQISARIGRSVWIGPSLKVRSDFCQIRPDRPDTRRSRPAQDPLPKDFLQLWSPPALTIDQSLLVIQACQNNQKENSTKITNTNSFLDHSSVPRRPIISPRILPDFSSAQGPSIRIIPRRPIISPRNLPDFSSTQGPSIRTITAASNTSE